MRDDNSLTFVRLAACFMIRDDGDNTYPFLCRGQQFVDEFGDAFEVELWDGETVIWNKTVTSSQMQAASMVSAVDERGNKD